MGHQIIVVISSLVAAACFYLVYMAYEAQDHGGLWFFAAFGLMFAALPLADIGKRLTRKKFPRLYDRIAGKEKARATFVPHWQMMSMIVIAVVAILLSISIPLLLK